MLSILVLKINCGLDNLKAVKNLEDGKFTLGLMLIKNFLKCINKIKLTIAEKDLMMKKEME